MQFGLYAPIPMATVGSAEVARAVTEAMAPLPPGRLDAQFDLGLELLQAADEVGFELVLFAERHLGNDLAAWIMASAIASRLNRIRALVAVHPGLWDPVMVGKLAVSLDRICRGRMAMTKLSPEAKKQMVAIQRLDVHAPPPDKHRVQHLVDRGVRRIRLLRLLRRWCPLSTRHPGLHLPAVVVQLPVLQRGRDFIAGHCDWWFVDYPKSAETTDDVVRGIEDAIADMNRRTARFGRKVRYALKPFVALGKDQDTAFDSTIRQIFAFDPDPDTLRWSPEMKLAYRLAAFDSRTDELVGHQAIPTRLFREIKEIAGIPADDDGAGDYPLDPDQALAIAKKLGIEIEPTSREYFLEPFEVTKHSGKPGARR